MADDIREMPMGMQTVLPEGGGTLSGGQKQRLCIARALVRDPKILIFDEATSALDKKTEDEVVDEIYQLKGQQTSIVIAHSASTLRHCDRIYRLENGLLEEFSTYDQFLRAGIPQ